MFSKSSGKTSIIFFPFHNIQDDILIIILLIVRVQQNYATVCYYSENSIDLEVSAGPMHDQMLLFHLL